MEGLGNDGGFAPQATGALPPPPPAARLLFFITPAAFPHFAHAQRTRFASMTACARGLAGMNGECQGGAYGTLRRLMEEVPFGALAHPPTHQQTHPLIAPCAPTDQTLSFPPRTVVE